MRLNPYGEQQDIRRVVMEKVQVGLRQMIDEHQLTIMDPRMDFRPDDLAMRTVADFRCYLWGTHTPSTFESESEGKFETVKSADYPISWWDHAKRDFKRRYPRISRRLHYNTDAVTVEKRQIVKRTVTTNITRICPQFPGDAPHSRLSLAWLADDEEGTPFPTSEAFAVVAAAQQAVKAGPNDYAVMGLLQRAVYRYEDSVKQGGD